MNKPRDSAKARRICVEAHHWHNLLGRKCLTCHVCKRAIDLHKEPTAWRSDHIRRHAEGGEDTAENLFPICLECDCGTEGKAADDTRTVAKGKRIQDKADGVRRRSSFPGWRKFDGTPVNRRRQS